MDLKTSSNYMHAFQQEKFVRYIGIILLRNILIQNENLYNAGIFQPTKMKNQTEIS